MLVASLTCSSLATAPQPASTLFHPHSSSSLLIISLHVLPNFSLLFQYLRPRSSSSCIFPSFKAKSTPPPLSYLNFHSSSLTYNQTSPFFSTSTPASSSSVTFALVHQNGGHSLHLKPYTCTPSPLPTLIPTHLPSAFTRLLPSLLPPVLPFLPLTLPIHFVNSWQAHYTHYFILTPF